MVRRRVYPLVRCSPSFAIERVRFGWQQERMGCADWTVRIGQKSELIGALQVQPIAFSWTIQERFGWEGRPLSNILQRDDTSFRRLHKGFDLSWKALPRHPTAQF